MAIILGKAVISDVTPTGAFGFGAQDQHQYLTWIREAGNHLLISNLFQIGPTDAVFLHPLALASGLLWKLGLPLQFAYVLWLPLALWVAVTGVLAYGRRLLPPGSSRLVMAVLAFFVCAPVVPLLDLSGVTTTTTALEAVRYVNRELTTASHLWGYAPTVIAIGLLPLAFLNAERAITGPGARRRSPLVVACACSLLMSWLHPWQGVTLAIVLGALLAWSRFRRDHLALLAVIACAMLPLIYYAALAGMDADWAYASEAFADKPSLGKWAVALACFSPLLFLAALGVKRPQDIQERILILWPIAALATVVLPNAGWYHAFNGVSIPLAVFMVRGWGNMRVPEWIRRRGLSPMLAAALVVALVLPGTANLLKLLRTSYVSSSFVYYSTASETQALRYLQDTREPGGVVAGPWWGTMVPTYSERQVWNGHFAWTPDYEPRNMVMERVMRGSLAPTESARVLQGTGARFLVTDCRFPPRETLRRLGPAVTPVRVFGCAGVYRIKQQ